MRILLLSQFYPPHIGGEERHVQTLARNLAARGHDVHVATQAYRRGVAAPQAIAGVTVHLIQPSAGLANAPTKPLPHALPVPDPLATAQIARIVRKTRPDVVHAHNWFLHSYLPLQATRRRPLVLTLHDYGNVCATQRLMYKGGLCTGPALGKCRGCAADHYGRLRGPLIASAVPLMRALDRRLLDRVLAVSRSVAQHNRLDDLGVPYEIVPNFVPADLAAPTNPPPADLPDRPYVVFVGDVTVEKGFRTLVEAYSRLEAPAFDLLVVGGGSGSGSTGIGLPSGVHLAGPRPHEWVMHAVARAVAAALPSQWADPCPTTVLEAQALGVPVIGTAMGGMADMLTHGESGWVVPAAQPQALAAALLRVASDPALRRRLAAGGLASVARFRADVVVDRIEQVYQAVLTPEAASD